LTANYKFMLDSTPLNLTKSKLTFYLSAKKKSKRKHRQKFSCIAQVRLF